MIPWFLQITNTGVARGYFLQKQAVPGSHWLYLARPIERTWTIDCGSVATSREPSPNTVTNGNNICRNERTGLCYYRLSACFLRTHPAQSLLGSWPSLHVRRQPVQPPCGWQSSVGFRLAHRAARCDCSTFRQCDQYPE